MVSGVREPKWSVKNLLKNVVWIDDCRKWEKLNVYSWKRNFFHNCIHTHGTLARWNHDLTHIWHKLLHCSQTVDNIYVRNIVDLFLTWSSWDNFQMMHYHEPFLGTLHLGIPRKLSTFLKLLFSYLFKKNTNSSNIYDFDLHSQLKVSCCCAAAQRKWSVLILKTGNWMTLA